MEQLIKVLVCRLVRKGVDITIVPAYIRDVANTIAIHRSLSLQELNSRLQLLGWDDDLDDYTLCLIMATFELNAAYDYKPPHWFDRSFDPEGLFKDAG